MKQLLLLLTYILPFTFIYAEETDSINSPYQLNVIYFLPKGVEHVEEYKPRLSEMLRYVQNFYGSEMKRNGYGYRSFVLGKDDDGFVDIITIRGIRDTSHYSNIGHGGANAKKEIDAYFKKYPNKKKSDHTLVFMAKVKEHHSGGVPYYGLGRYAFVMDYKGYDLKHLGQDNSFGKLLPTYLGGLAHELGHGINLPHNKEIRSQARTLGTTLMGRGNYTLGKSPTFLTKADCAILNNCQVFSPVKREFYTEKGDIKWKNLSFDFDKDKIQVKGSIKTDKEVNGVIAYFDPAPYGANKDYDAESFYSDLGADSFNIEIPYKELHEAFAADYQIRIRLLHTDGTFSETSRIFKRPFPKPYKLDYKKELSKKDWKVNTSDHQKENPGHLLIDGKQSTFWHSKWAPEKIDYPHWVEITFPKSTMISGISLCQRESLHGALEKITIQMKDAKGKWSEPIEYTLEYHNAPQYFDLSIPASINGLKINAIATYTDRDPMIASLAEIGVY